MNTRRVAVPARCTVTVEVKKGCEKPAESGGTPNSFTLFCRSQKRAHDRCATHSQEQRSLRTRTDRAASCHSAVPGNQRRKLASIAPKANVATTRTQQRANRELHGSFVTGAQDSASDNSSSERTESENMRKPLASLHGPPLRHHGRAAAATFLI